MRYDAQMTNFIFNDGDSVAQIRDEIASLAAKFIAEEGAEYGTAKRRAVKQLLGNQKLNGNILPDNTQIEQQVREYQALFFADSRSRVKFERAKKTHPNVDSLSLFCSHSEGCTRFSKGV